MRYLVGDMGEIWGRRRARGACGTWWEIWGRYGEGGEGGVHAVPGGRYGGDMGKAASAGCMRYLVGDMGEIWGRRRARGAWLGVGLGLGLGLGPSSSVCAAPP